MHPKSPDTQDHLDQHDLTRAEKNSDSKAPLEGNEEDIHIPDTELTHASPEAEEDGKENDPTSAGSDTH